MLYAEYGVNYTLSVEKYKEPMMPEVVTTVAKLAVYAAFLGPSPENHAAKLLNAYQKAPEGRKPKIMLGNNGFRLAYPPEPTAIPVGAAIMVRENCGLNDPRRVVVASLSRKHGREGVNYLDPQTRQTRWIDRTFVVCVITPHTIARGK